jgi:hypothetical protein
MTIKSEIVIIQVHQREIASFTKNSFVGFAKLSDEKVVDRK